MIDLPNVHLISVIGGGHDVRLFSSALNLCMEQCSFGKATLLSHTGRPDRLDDRAEHVKIQPMDVRGYSRLVLFDLADYIDCDFVMIVQSDGFIVNPNAWHPEMLNYDYIGAPWPIGRPQLCRVGNGGFSIRSKRLHKYIQSAVKEKCPLWTGNNEDEFICTTHRETFENAGFTFAPPSMAARFSIEFRTWHHDDLGLTPFGFHGWYDGRHRTYQPLLRKHIF